MNEPKFPARLTFAEIQRVRDLLPLGDPLRGYLQNRLDQIEMAERAREAEDC